MGHLRVSVSDREVQRDLAERTGEVIWREVIIDREGEYIRQALKPAGRLWWWGVFVWWTKLVGRRWEGRIDARTAWELAEGMCDIVRDPQAWQRMRDNKRAYHDACRAEVEPARREASDADKG